MLPPSLLHSTATSDTNSSLSMAPLPSASKCLSTCRTCSSGTSSSPSMFSPLPSSVSFISPDPSASTTLKIARAACAISLSVPRVIELLKDRSGREAVEQLAVAEGEAGQRLLVLVLHLNPPLRHRPQPSLQLLPQKPPHDSLAVDNSYVALGMVPLARKQCLQAACKVNLVPLLPSDPLQRVHVLGLYRSSLRLHPLTVLLRLVHPDLGAHLHLHLALALIAREPDRQSVAHELVRADGALEADEPSPGELTALEKDRLLDEVCTRRFLPDCDPSQLSLVGEQRCTASKSSYLTHNLEGCPVVVCAELIEDPLPVVDLSCLGLLGLHSVPPLALQLHHMLASVRRSPVMSLHRTPCSMSAGLSVPSEYSRFPDSSIRKLSSSACCRSRGIGRSAASDLLSCLVSSSPNVGLSPSRVQRLYLTEKSPAARSSSDATCSAELLRNICRICRDTELAPSQAAPLLLTAAQPTAAPCRPPPPPPTFVCCPARFGIETRTLGESPRTGGLTPALRTSLPEETPSAPAPPPTRSPPCRRPFQAHVHRQAFGVSSPKPRAGPRTRAHEPAALPAASPPPPAPALLP
eukprot:750360-Hanusia_phi.AAC.2